MPALASGQKPGQARPEKARARPGHEGRLGMAYGLAWIFPKPEPAAWARALHTFAHGLYILTILKFNAHFAVYF